MAPIAVLKRSCLLLLWLGACARDVPQTVAYRARVASCSCPAPPPDQLPLSPAPQQVLDAMVMAKAGIQKCVGESGTVTVRIAIDGASGLVSDVISVDSPQAGSEVCVAHVLLGLCFPRFHKPVHKIQFPYKVGAQSKRDRGAAAEPRCPASAAPWSSDVLRAEEDARASARQSYQAKYGATCEAELAGQKPLPTEPLPRAIAADVKQSVLSARIEEVHGCYLDALAGWPDSSKARSTFSW